MAVPIGSMHELQVVYLVNGQKCRNVFHYKLDDGVAGLEPWEFSEHLLSQVAGPGVGQLSTLFASLQATNVHVVEVTAQMVWPTRWRIARASVDVAGVRAGTCTAQNVQACLDKFGSQANRHNQGSMHIGGLSATDYSGGLLTAGFMTAFEFFKAMIALNLATVGPVSSLTPVIANKEKVPDSNPVKYRYSGWSETLGWSTSPELRTQRTRNFGKGE